MPILEVEIVGEPSLPQDLAARIASAAGTVLKTKPGHTWVKVRTLSTDAYAENETPFNHAHPVFVSLLLAVLPNEDQRAQIAKDLTEVIAVETKRPIENVHLFFQPEGAGRAAFGGELLSKKPNPQRSFSGAPWETKVGYCRAILSGNQIAVTGTVSVDDHGEAQGIGDAYAQAKRSFEIIEKAILPLGARRENIIRTRMFVTDISQWSQIGRAHAEFFSGHPPATTMVEIKSLIDPRFLVEIEADAVI